MQSWLTVVLFGEGNPAPLRHSPVITLVRGWSGATYKVGGDCLEKLQDLIHVPAIEVSGWKDPAKRSLGWTMLWIRQFKGVQVMYLNGDDGPSDAK